MNLLGWEIKIEDHRYDNDKTGTDELLITTSLGVNF